MSENLATKKPKIDSFLNHIYEFIDWVHKKYERKKYLLLPFLIPMAIMFIVYLALQIHPFGERSVLVLDMNGQYVYFFEQLRDVLVGDSSLYYTFERSLGGEFLGYFTYYLASPLSFIVALFPKTMITEAIMLLLTLKAGLCGLTFSIYLDKTRKKNVVGFTLFSVMYSLCAYATIYQTNTMWIDALIWLPLVVLGIERLVKRGRFKLFIISLALTIWSNYYIGYMVCIFVVLYFFYYIFAHSNDEINLLGEKKHRLKSLLRIALFSLIAILLAGAVIVSAYYSLQFGKSDLQNNSFEPTLRMDILDLISKLFIGSYDTVRSEGTPNIYCGIFALIMLPAFFISKKIKGREKIGYIILLAIFVMSFSVNTIDLVWHGFQMPIWLNYRYSFMFSFLLLVMAYKGFECFEDLSCKYFAKVAALLAVILVLIQKLVTLTKYVDSEKTEVTPSYQMIWLSIGIILAYFIVVFVYKHTKNKSFMSVVLLLCVSCEAFGSTLLNWADEIYDVGWASRTAYRTVIDPTLFASKIIKETDKSFYRMEKTYQRKANDNLAVDFKGVSEFTSTFNESTRDLLKNLGFYASSQTTKYYSNNVFSDSLLGIKYLLSTGYRDDDGKITEVMSSEYPYVEISNGYVLYQNPYALPLAFAVDKNIKNAVLDPNLNSPFDYHDYLLAHMTGDENATPYITCSYYVNKNRSYNLKNYGGKGNVLQGYVDAEGTSYYRSSSGMASINFTVTAQKDGSIYMFLPSLYNTKATCYVNGKELGVLFQSDSYKVHNIGTYKKGEKIEVNLAFDANRIYLLSSDKFFVQIDDEGFGKICDSFTKNGYNIKEYSDTYLEGTLKSDGDKVVFTTIPYDKQWRVYVDNERVDTFECAESMLAFDISGGEHEVILKYVPMQWYGGVVLSLTGAGLFTLLCVLDYRKKKKLKLNEENK